MFKKANRKSQMSISNTMTKKKEYDFKKEDLVLFPRSEFSVTIS